MLAKTAEDVQGKLVGGVFDRLFTPAAFFWLAGFAAWGGADVTRFDRVAAQLTSLSDLKLLVPTAALLATVIFSSAAYEPLNGWLLRRLAGYWGPFDFAAAPLRALMQRRQRDMLAELDRLSRKPVQTPGERGSVLRLEDSLRALPGDPDEMLPTSFGCTLLASDRFITTKYGLEPQICWPALAYVLPDAARKDLTDASTAIEASGRLIFWTLASLVWIAVAPRPFGVVSIAAGVTLVAGFAYVRLVRQARNYAQAYEAAFDVGRPALYKALRFPLPKDPLEEVGCGEALTKYLRRGVAPALMPFTPAS